MIRLALILLSRAQYFLFCSIPSQGGFNHAFCKVKNRLAEELGSVISVIRHAQLATQRTDNDKRVLISMCTFQGERWVDAAIRSLMQLNYSNWHLFILDDGSTDKTQQMLEVWKTKYPHQITIKILPTNSYPETATNHSIQWFLDNPEFDAFTILDQDDIAEPDFLNICLSLMNDHCRVIRCRNARYNADFSEFFYNYVASSQLLIARDVIERLGMRINCGQGVPTDADYLNRIFADAAAHDYSVVNTRKVCQKMRIHGSNQMLKQNTKKAIAMRKRLGIRIRPVPAEQTAKNYRKV